MIAIEMRRQADLTETVLLNPAEKGLRAQSL